MLSLSFPVCQVYVRLVLPCIALIEVRVNIVWNIIIIISVHVHNQRQATLFTSVFNYNFYCARTCGNDRSGACGIEPVHGHT